MKLLSYRRINAERYFWRTTQQQEIDYLEEVDGEFTAFEFKWNTRSEARFSKTFTRNYPVREMRLVNPANFDGFILEG